MTNIVENGDSQIIEFPLAVYKLFGIKIPVAGGFWLRLWSLNTIKEGIRKINEKGFPAVIYIHNWELDEETPQLNVGVLGRIQAYHNLSKTEQKLRSLLNDFHFVNFATYLRES
jgi:hypothetical protein